MRQRRLAEVEGSILPSVAQPIVEVGRGFVSLKDERLEGRCGRRRKDFEQLD